MRQSHLRDKAYQEEREKEREREREREREMVIVSEVGEVGLENCKVLFHLIHWLFLLCIYFAMTQSVVHW